MPFFFTTCIRPRCIEKARPPVIYLRTLPRYTASVARGVGDVLLLWRSGSTCCSVLFRSAGGWCGSAHLIEEHVVGLGPREVAIVALALWLDSHTRAWVAVPLRPSSGRISILSASPQKRFVGGMSQPSLRECDTTVTGRP